MFLDFIHDEHIPDNAVNPINDYLYNFQTLIEAQIYGSLSTINDM